ncbi:hypothetical protein ELI35_35980 [Rhizobium ruizarguesonis]|nr:hypothetical protein ELI35_35980 [Rhizobium ruizarguesonis]
MSSSLICSSDNNFNNPSRAQKYPLDKHLYAQRHLSKRTPLPEVLGCPELPSAIDRKARQPRCVRRRLGVQISSLVFACLEKLTQVHHARSAG